MHAIAWYLSFPAFKCETAWKVLLTKVASRPLLATSVNNEGTECPGEFELLVEEERTYPIGSVATAQLRNYQAFSMKCESLLYKSLLISFVV